MEDDARTEKLSGLYSIAHRAGDAYYRQVGQIIRGEQGHSGELDKRLIDYLAALSAYKRSLIELGSDADVTEQIEMTDFYVELVRRDVEHFLLERYGSRAENSDGAQANGEHVTLENIFEDPYPPSRPDRAVRQPANSRLP